MRQQVSDGEHRIAGIFAQHDLDECAVLFDDHAVQGERPGQPLIFADAAVVVGLGLPDAHLFLKRALLEVKARGVGMGADEAHARSERLLALARHEDGLAPIGAEHEILCEIFGKAGTLQRFNHEIHGFAFGFRMGEEIHVAGGQCVHLFLACRIGVVRPAVFGFEIEFVVHVCCPLWFGAS